MSRTTRRLATMLAGMFLLGALTGYAGAPAGAAESPVGTLAVEFAPDDYPQCAFNGSDRTIRYMVDRIVANSPDAYYRDGDLEEQAPLYQPPTDAERADVRAGLRALIRDDPATATQRLDEAGYAVCSGDIDTTFYQRLVLVYHVDGLSPTETEGAPMLLLYPGDIGAKSVLSGPHVRYEENVKDQILAALDNPSHFTKGAVLSGTHRCNREAAAPEPFQGDSPCDDVQRISDMAHNLNTIFQDMHTVLREEYPDTFLVQLHGMSHRGISVSRGDNPEDGSATHPGDPVTRAHAYAKVELEDELGFGFPGRFERYHLTTCTPYIHSGTTLDAPVEKLHCGTTNAQLAAEAANGTRDRFIHIEQSPYIRENHPGYIRWVMYGLHDD